MKSKGMSALEYVGVGLFLLALYGYPSNIYKFVESKKPWDDKINIVRVSGMIIFPLGIVMGYVDDE